MSNWFLTVMGIETIAAYVVLVIGCILFIVSEMRRIVKRWPFRAS